MGEKGIRSWKSAGHANVRRRAGASIGVLAGVLAAWVCQVSYATGYIATGTITRLSSYDLTWFGANVDFFNVSGVTSLGTCGVANGSVVFRLHDDVRGQRMFAGLTADKLVGNPITVYVDDQYKDSSGFCYTQTIDF
jgi:hypothetical protein